MTTVVNKSNWKRAYHAYLTRKVDRGVKNIVVDTTTKILLTKISQSNRQVRVADIGCFTGSIANRIYHDLPSSIRKKTEFFGLDKNKKIIALASRQRPHISFMKYDLSKKPVRIKPFQVIILSNVLHELYSEKLPDIEHAKRSVVQAIRNIRNLMSPDGYLVVLDGILPDNSDQSIKIEFLSKHGLREFIRFSQSDYISHITCRKLGGNVIETTIAGLASYLTKARYLKKDYWNQESQQVYQYFTANDFRKTLLSMGIQPEEIIPQPIAQVDKKLRILTPNIEVPPKNILIKARRSW